MKIVKKIMLLTIMSFCVFSCGPEDEERHGEPRFFIHPETDVEYYYEVPSGAVAVSDMEEFCKNLDFDGGGWEWVNIDDLREIVTDCPRIMAGGSCEVTDDNNCKTECDCEGRDGEDQSVSDHISLLHVGDAEKVGCSFASSTDVGGPCVYSRGDMGIGFDGSSPYYKLNFCYNRINNSGELLSREYTDPLCVRNKKPKEFHGEPRTFYDEDTGNEFYYEVPFGSIRYSSLQNYCSWLDHDGGGWRIANIDELRELVEHCPGLEPDGKCEISEESKCYRECYCSRDSASIFDYKMRMSKILNYDDEKEGCHPVYSSTDVDDDCASSSSSMFDDKLPYFTINFCDRSVEISADRTITRYSDPMCIR